MCMMSFLNTRYSGQIRTLIFQQDNEWFGVALELNIVEHADTPEEAEILLNSALAGYLEAARKSKSSMHVLNQDTDPEYEALWSKDDAEDSPVFKRSAQRVPAIA